MLSPGLYDNIPENEYHADRTALSYSGAKLMLKAPAHFRWQMDNPRVSTTEFDFGHAAHALILGVGLDLAVHEYDADKIKSPKSTKAWKEQYAEVETDGGVLLLPSEYAKVQAMADKLSEHTYAMQLLSEGRPEVSAYAEDPATGVRIRGRFDWLGERIITDYKTAESSDPDEFVRHAVNYDYDTQAAFYLDLAVACGHPGAGFAHIVQEKRPPYLVTVIVLPPELIERGRSRKARALEMYRDCVESGTWPGYIPDDEFATPAAPLWALRKEAEYE